MTDLTQYLPQSSTWFSNIITYTGIARIEFSSPKGWIEGDTTCNIDNIGNMLVSFHIKRWENYDESNEPSSINSLNWLVSGIKPRTLGSMTFLANQTNNILTSFHLNTIDGGTLISNDIFDYSYSHNTPDLITIYFNRLEYLAHNQTKDRTKYWVVPCINLNLTDNLGTQSYNFSDLRQHPLRIFPYSQKTDDFLKSSTIPQDKGWVEHNTIALGYVVAFLYDNKPAFIERLPDYNQVINRLKTGESRLGVTCIMVGEYNHLKTELDPVNLLPVLGLATGRPVGASWIEFRDDLGNLVYRLHANLGQYSYGRGRPIINDIIHNGGLGKLLSQASLFEKLNNPLIRGSLINCAEGISGYDGSIIFYNIFTALDGLFTYYADYINKRIHPIKSFLTSKQINDIENILTIAKNDIEKIKSITANPKTNDEKQQLRVIDIVANKVRSLPLQGRNEFGDKLVTLMEYLSFYDMDVLSNYQDWANRVTKYRNTTMHSTYYENIHSPQTKKDFEQLLPHLIDILIRILLKTIGYTGHYAPFVKTPNHSFELNWVKIDFNKPHESTTPEDLGYK